MIRRRLGVFGCGWPTPAGGWRPGSRDAADTCLIARRASLRPQIEALRSPEFRAFQRNYLLVYLLVQHAPPTAAAAALMHLPQAFFADWLKGPYVYALYDFYGYDQREIAILFICGFFASMVVGTFVGGLSDKLGQSGVWQRRWRRLRAQAPRQAAGKCAFCLRCVTSLRG